MVGSTPWSTAPKMLNTSPRSQTIMKMSERPSAEERRKFSTIWGLKTTTQQAIDTEPHIPLTASKSRLGPDKGGDMSKFVGLPKVRAEKMKDDAFKKTE